VADYAIAVIEDAIGILDILKRNPNGLSLAEITEETDLVKNKVFRILFTLEQHQMAERDEHGRYRLGMRLLELGQHVQNNTSLLGVSAAVMDRLVAETRESIFLGVISGDEVLCVATRESPRSVRLYAEVGRRAPFDKGGIPKVLFAHIDDDERTSYLDRMYSDDAQAGERERLMQVCEQIRRDGYVVAVDDLDPGAHSIAAPIRNYQGVVVAAISIAGPSDRFPPDVIEHYIELIRQAADEISGALGYVAPPEALRSNIQRHPI